MSAPTSISILNLMIWGFLLQALPMGLAVLSIQTSLHSHLISLHSLSLSLPPGCAWIYTVDSLLPEPNSCMYLVGLSLVLSLTSFPGTPIWDPWVGIGSGFRPPLYPLSITGGHPLLAHLFLGNNKPHCCLTGRQTLNNPVTDLLSSQILLSSLSAIEDSRRKPKTHLNTE